MSSYLPAPRCYSTTPDKDLVGAIIGSRVIWGKPDVLSDVGGAFQGKDRSREPPKDGISRLIHMIRSRVTRRNKATAAGYTTSDASGLSSRLEISLLFPRHTRPDSARILLSGWSALIHWIHISLERMSQEWIV